MGCQLVYLSRLDNLCKEVLVCVCVYMSQNEFLGIQSITFIYQLLLEDPMTSFEASCSISLPILDCPPLFLVLFSSCPQKLSSEIAVCLVLCLREAS